MYRVLYILPWSITGHGGVNEVVRKLIASTAADDEYQPLLVESDWDSPEFRSIAEAPCKIYRKRLPSPVGPPSDLIAAVGMGLKMYPELRRWRSWLVDRKIETINAHYLGPGLITIALLKSWMKGRFSFLVSVHGMDISRLSDIGWFERKVIEFILGKADAIVACSRDLAEKVRTAYPRLAHRVRCIHNGIEIDSNPKKVQESTRRLIASSVPYIVNVATFEQKKGQDVLLKAFAEFNKQSPTHRLLLIGRQTKYLDVLTDAAESLGISSKVTFLENVPHGDTLELISNASLFVLPSRAEPFGIVLLEAATMKVPVIASRVGGVPEVLGEDYPYLVDAEDPLQLMVAMTHLLDEHSDRHRIVESLYDRAVGQFSQAASYAGYRQLFGRTASGGGDYAG